MDYNLFFLINNIAGKWICLDSLAIFFAKYFIYYLVAGATILFFLIKDKKEKIKYLILTLLSVILSRLIITEIIRLFWYCPRPFVAHAVNLLIEHNASASFPSGHIAFLFALATAIYFFNKKFGIAFLGISFLVGLARVFVGVHYPLDILGGIVMGIFSAIFIKFLFRKKQVNK
jgi:undecaprenyl-diphosphatase